MNTEAFWSWLQTGIQMGWVSSAYCDTHAGIPMSDGEELAYELGEEPCLFAVRIYVDGEGRATELPGGTALPGVPQQGASST